MSATADAPRWRAVAVTTLLPTLLFSAGEGAIVPVLPVVAGDLGTGLAGAGLVAAMLLVGELLGDIPSGVLIARVGERAAMIGAAVLALAGTALAWLAPHPLLLAAGVLVIGVAGAVFALARHAFLTTFVPIAYRARALSTLGGTHRLGMFLGPFATAALLELTGAPAAAFGVLAVACVAVAAVLGLLRDPESVFGVPPSRRGRAAHPTTGESEVAAEAHGLFRTLWARRRVLGTVGVGSAVMSALRSSRIVILPLWAVSIGVDETATAIVIGVAGAVDFALFYTGGWIMDRLGRLWVAVPCLTGLSLGHLALAPTHDLAGAATWFVALAIALAVTNGLSSGILMTIGADLADRRDPARFLGAWRFTNDAGSAAAPLVISGVTAAASLPVAAVVVGAAGLVGAAVWLIALPRHLPRVT